MIYYACARLQKCIYPFIFTYYCQIYPNILNPYILRCRTVFRWASLVNTEKVSFYTGSGIVLGTVTGLLLVVICHFPTEFTALVTLGITVASLIASLFA